MSNLQFDIVIPSKVKLRHQLRDGDQRFNKETREFEAWDATTETWKPVTSASGGEVSGDYVTHEELEAHRNDPEGHPIATTTKAGFVDAQNMTKLMGFKNILDPDPTTAFDNALK